MCALVWTIHQRIGNQQWPHPKRKATLPSSEPTEVARSTSAKGEPSEAFSLICAGTINKSDLYRNQCR